MDLLVITISINSLDFLVRGEINQYLAPTLGFFVVSTKPAHAEGITCLQTSGT